MIVDDHGPFRSVARRLVEATDGLRLVAVAASGEEAVDLAGTTRPALVVMDVQLPGISGMEATRRITSSAPGTIVVLTSTYDEPSLHDEPASCGAACYIRKELLSPAALLDVLHRSAGPP